MSNVLSKKRICGQCGSTGLRRVNRHGYLQRVIWPIFGFYPWECVMCRGRRYLRDEGRRSGSRQAA